MPPKKIYKLDKNQQTLRRHRASGSNADHTQHSRETIEYHMSTQLSTDGGKSKKECL